MHPISSISALSRIYTRATCCHQQQLASSGNMLPVSQKHNYYSFMSLSTCIPLYPATDGQQTGNNFVDSNKQHVDGNMLPGNMLPWCKRGFSCAEDYISCNTCAFLSKLLAYIIYWSVTYQRQDLQEPAITPWQLLCCRSLPEQLKPQTLHNHHPVPPSHTNKNCILLHSLIQHTWRKHLVKHELNHMSLKLVWSCSCNQMR